MIFVDSNIVTDLLEDCAWTAWSKQTLGAHAAALGAKPITRDKRCFRTYFPELALITPETDHG